MDVKQYLLTKLAEEASEIAQAALKAQQFGLESFSPVTGIENAQALYSELDDLIAIVSLLNEQGFGFNYETNPDAIERKFERVQKHLDISINLGYVQVEIIN